MYYKKTIVCNSLIGAEIGVKRAEIKSSEREWSGERSWRNRYER